MNFFEEASLRLKQQLKTSQDKEVAALLGMSAQSWAGRKKRGNFPEKELRALVQQRPDLGIDVDYVLGTTGFGTRLRHERLRLDMDEGEMAEALEMPLDSYCAIEAGQREPNDNLKARLYALPRVDAVFLMGGMRSNRAGHVLRDREEHLLTLYREVPEVAAAIDTVLAMGEALLTARRGDIKR